MENRHCFSAEVVEEHKKRKDHGAVLFEGYLKSCITKYECRIPKRLIQSKKAKQLAIKAYEKTTLPLFEEVDNAPIQASTQVLPKVRKTIRAPWFEQVK